MSSTPSSTTSPTASTSTSTSSASAARVGGEGGFNSQRSPVGGGIGGGGVKVTPAAPLVRPPAYSDNLSPPFTPPYLTVSAF